jgi:lipid-A-disaccharide synthase-like uncharacterized protein
MVINIYVAIAIVGLFALTAGAFLISEKKATRRKYVYPLLLLGGICLEIYSIYIQDLIFIILQAIYIVVNIYGWFRVHHRIRKN